MAKQIPKQILDIKHKRGTGECYITPVLMPETVKVDARTLANLYAAVNTPALVGAVDPDIVYGAFHSWLAILPKYKFGPVRNAVNIALDIEGRIPRTIHEGTAFGIITALDVMAK